MGCCLSSGSEWAYDAQRVLLEWAVCFEPRTWAVERATGMGAMLAQQFVAVG